MRLKSNAPNDLAVMKHHQVFRANLGLCILLSLTARRRVARGANSETSRSVQTQCYPDYH